MKSSKCLALCFMLVSICALAQEESEVMKPVNTLFEGMQKGDSALSHTAFYPQAKMYSVALDRAGQPVLKGDIFKNFLMAVGTPHKEVLNEMTWSPKIEVNGNLAQVWVPYALYIGKTFSHCGVDAFHLIKNGKGEWKIFHLVDTRQKEGCVIPAEVSDKMK